MITLDEAIERELNIAHKGSDCWKHCSNTKKHCKDCMAEHEQLAEWLEELKKRRSEDYGYLADIHQDIGYRKAIDDFMKEICKMIVQSENNGNHRFYAVEIKQAIADLAERLKAGGRE